MRTRMALSLLLLVPTLAMAQGKAQSRQGFGISFGLGSGSAGISCDGCSSDRENGMSGYLRIGGLVRPNLFVAGESNGWLKSEAGVDEMISFLSAVAQWYPSVAKGWYAKGGLGVSVYSATDGTDDMSATAGAITLGGGYDYRMGTNFSLTPFVNYLYGMEGDVKVNGTATGGKFGPNVLQLGLGFTWH
jgi:hypothetical protein